jgi:hypothetical protein
MLVNRGIFVLEVAFAEGLGFTYPTGSATLYSTLTGRVTD